LIYLIPQNACSCENRYWPPSGFLQVWVIIDLHLHSCSCGW
jgi:hypothetical protein